MSEQSPQVGIVMGSDSDWPTMKAAAEALEEFGVPFEADVVSAHRMPEEMLAYGKEAAGRGLRVIIAGAGGAAHLPGMLAAVTPLPVIGVPVALKYLDGMDSLLSIVQMPAGVPVATVAVGNARNAGLLAVRILAASDEGLRQRMVDFQEELAASAREKGKAVRGDAGRKLGRLSGRLSRRPAVDRLTGPARHRGPLHQAGVLGGERQQVGCLGGDRGRGHPRPVPGGGLDPGQHRGVAALSALQLRGELEAVRGHHPVVVVAGHHQRRRVAAPSTTLCNGEYASSVSNISGSSGEP